MDSALFKRFQKIYLSEFITDKTEMELENPKKDKLLETLYSVCCDRSLTSGQVFDLVVEKVGLIGVSHVRDQAIEVIRPYKQSGKNLELTLNKLYDILYSTSSGGTTWG